MKKTLFALFVFLQFSGLWGQTLISEQHLDLKDAEKNRQILDVVNPKTQEIFVFATDKNDIMAQKYNSALFFVDSIAAKRPDKDYAFMTGYGFDENDNPDLYWASADFKKILSVHYDFQNQDSSVIVSDLPFSNEKILGSFSENGCFYILSLVKTEKKLKFYIFTNGKPEEKVVDFSAYNFTDEKNNPLELNALLEENPVENIETKSLNPLYYGTKKIKLYVLDNKMYLTFDHNANQTQLFEVDLGTFAVTEKIMPQPVLKKDSNTNSYLYQDKLYQIKLNSEEMVFTARSLDSGELIKAYSVTAHDTINFKNSPLYSQTGNQRAFELKNTKKFLRKLSQSAIGLSVYKTPDDILITLGGSREVASTGQIFLGASLGVGLIIAGGGNLDIVENIFDKQNLQTVYFEGLFDDHFQYKDLEQEKLAADYIAQFLNENSSIELQNVFNYRDYYILGYYDSKTKQYIMRKFSDDSTE